MSAARKAGVSAAQAALLRGLYVPPDAAPGTWRHLAFVNQFAFLVDRDRAKGDAFAPESLRLDPVPTVTARSLVRRGLVVPVPSPSEPPMQSFRLSRLGSEIAAALGGRP